MFLWGAGVMQNSLNTNEIGEVLKTVTCKAWRKTKGWELERYQCQEKNLKQRR